jgi:Helicase HerA, central domain
MNTIVAPAVETAVVDPRLEAFLVPDCREVFYSVAQPTALWQPDPFDVKTIHAEAREVFDALLFRATQSPLSGAVLVLKGEAGSGKTHLMRAFRTSAHAAPGFGYCGYLQMTTETSNYPRYMLNNLIDSLEQPYTPGGRTGLTRLSAALLELVPGLTDADRQTFREGESDPAPRADDYADRLQQLPQFQGCDLELIRVMLHLQRNEPQVRSRALMWLRCQDMRPRDRDWIGGAVSRTDEADPQRMLIQPAKLTNAVESVPLVLLIDQLEDMANQSAPVDRFRKVVDAITAFTDTVPNAVVVLACLEDYFEENVKQILKSKHDRLTRDPEPIRVLGNRTLDEIREMVALRLAHLYDTAEVETESADKLYPFREEHLARLDGLRTRDVLEFLQKHHHRCIAAGRWIEPEGIIIKPPPPPVNELDPLWNDFHSTFSATVPDGEEELAGVLGDAIRAVSPELPDGSHLGCTPRDGRSLEVELHEPNNAVKRWALVAVCNKNTRGGGLGKQIDEVEKRLGDFPAALVRTTEFPRTGKVAKQIAGMLRRKGVKVVVADADLRRMLAFEAFRVQHSTRPDFADWQKRAHPLGELDSLQKILRLKEIAAPRHAVTPAPVAPPPPPPVEPVPPAVPSDVIVLGKTQSLTPTPVTFEPDNFVYHAAFLGGTGSGKTTAALNLIEQLLQRGVPAVLVDRKGDLCRYADRAAWERPLGDPAHEVARKQLRDKLDVSLFTPGEPNGRPLALRVVPPEFDKLNESDRERFAQYAAGALGSMIGFKTSDADRGQRAILAKAIETLAATGATITVPVLREVIGTQDDALLNAIGGGYPEKYFTTLAQRLLTLELNNKLLLTGSETLDVDALLGTGTHARPGRVRLSIVSTRFLDPAKGDFWVSQLLVAVSRWCARAPRNHIQAVFLFDEADVYLPAGTKQPATKAPMEDLLKRARSAGVGIFLATQSPGDFDYKCKENVRTWLLGRVKEPRALEKLKPMLAAARSGAVDKLAGQATGEFTLVREANVTAIRSEESFLRTEQIPEHQIADLARRSR